MLYVSSVNKKAVCYSVTDSSTGKVVVYSSDELFDAARKSYTGIRGVNCGSGCVRDYSNSLRHEAMAIRDRVLGKVSDFGRDELERIYPVFSTNAYEIELPEWAEVVHGYTFLDAKKVTSVTCNAELQEISDYAFSGMSTLIEVNLNEGLRIIGKSAFMNSCVINVKIPSSVSCIRDYAFTNASDLESIVLPDTLKRIGVECFHYCGALSRVNIPKNCRRIEKGAFRYSAIRNLSFPSTLKFIGEVAFEGCNALDNLSIPDGCTEIGYNAFYLCNKLKNVKFPKNLTEEEIFHITQKGSWGF